MAFDLDEAMGASAPTKPKTSTRVKTKPSGFDLDAAIKNTPSVPISKPQEPIKRKASLLNPVEDIVTGVQQTIPQLPQMALDFGKSAVNNFTGQGIVNTLPAIARGAATGVVDLAPSVAGLGVDLVNSIAGKPIINMPEERRRPLGYALEQWRDIQDAQNNLAIPSYPGQNPAELGIKPATGIGQYISGNNPGAEKAQFAETMANFAVPLGSINAGVKGTKIAKEAAKISKDLATRVSPKAAIKYGSNIDKLAKERAIQNIKNGVKTQAPKTAVREIADNIKLGGMLGALEGNNLEERAGNAFGGAALGGALSGLHIGGRKAWNSEKGKQIRADFKEGLDTLADESPKVSQLLAFVDSTLNTNLAKKGSVTDLRKQWFDKNARNENFKKNMSDQNKAILDETGTVNNREAKKIAQINQYGKKTYNEQTNNGAKDFKENYTNQEAINKLNEKFRENTTDYGKAEYEQQQKQPQKQNYEFIPEPVDKPLTGNVPQQPINHQKPSISHIEKARIKKQAEQHRKETNNFKFPEENESQAPESNLSQVKEKVDTITPKEDLTTVKNDSRSSKKKNTSQANEQLKQDLKNNTFKPASMNERNLESVIKLPSGEAEGANELYKQTKGRENIFENVEKEKSTGRTSASSYSEETIKQLKAKYTVAADGKTVIYRGGKKDGRRVPQKELEDLRKRLENEEIEQEEYINREDTYEDEYENRYEKDSYDKYSDNISEEKIEEKPNRYSSDNPDFIEWYDMYSKSSEKSKQKLLEQKLKSIKTIKERNKFYDEFTRQEENDLYSSRQRKIGDEYYDTSDLRESERLSDAVRETEGEVEYERTPIEEQKKGISPAQRKFVDNIWNEKVKGNTPRKLAYQGRLGRCRDSKSLQAEYDKIVNEIKSSNRSAKVKQIMIEDFNNIADKVVESKKNFNVEINKFENFDVEADAINALEKAMDAKDLAKAKEIIENNELKYNFVKSDKGKKLIKQYYTERADNVYKKSADLGFKYSNGKVTYDPKQALEYCKKQVLSQFNGNPDKLKMELSRLKNPKVVKNRMLAEYDKLLKQNENIIKNDVRFAYDKNQRTFNRETLKYEENGDIFDRKQSGADIGEQEAKQTWDALSEPTKSPETDNTKPALGRIASSLEEGKVKDFNSADKIFEKLNLPQGIKNLFSKHKRQGVAIVSKDSIPFKSLYNHDSHELLIREDLSNANKVSKLAHELGHRNIHEAIENGGEEAIHILNRVYDRKAANEILSLTNEDIASIKESGVKKGLKGDKLTNYIEYEKKSLKQQKAVDKLKEAVEKNREENNRLEEVVNELKNEYDSVYGDGFVKDTIKEYYNLIKQGKTERTLSKDKRTLIKKYREAIPTNEVEDYCIKQEREVLDEYRRQELDSKNRIEGENRPRGVRSGELDSSERTGKETSRTSGEGTQSKNQSNANEGRTRGLENSEYSSVSPKVFDFFKKKKEQREKSGTYKKVRETIDNAKVNKITDAFKTLSESRENDFKEYGTFSEEQMKNRLYQQSLDGEGIYTLQAGKASDKVDLSRKKKPRPGFTYEKEKQGLNRKGTTEQNFAMNLADQVRRDSARDKVEFLKENFKEKKEGYIPVNSKLLWNAIYWGKSKAWYETISKGKEAITEYFGEDSKFHEFYDRIQPDNADIYVPKDMLDLALSGSKELPLDYLSTYGKGKSMRYKIKGMLKLAGATLDWYNDRFKRKVLTSASFIANNRIGNQIMLMANSKNAKEYFDSWKDAKKMNDNDVPREILESTLSEALNNETNKKVRRYFSEENGVLETAAQLMDGQYVDLKTIDGLKKVGYGVLNGLVAFPNRVFKEISHRMGELNERMERFERKQATSIALKKIQRDKVLKTARKMITVEELAKQAKDNPVLRQTIVDKVDDILGDYNNFNKFEKNVLKRVQPFYSWNRTIIRHILNLYKEDPVRASLILYENYRLQNQDDGLVDWQHSAIKLPFKNKRTNSNIVINKAKIIPYNTPFEWFDGEGLGTLSPALLKPVEAIRGEKFFKGNPEITSKKWKKATQNYVKGYYNNKTGEFREGSLPLDARIKYLGKDYTEAVYPAMGSPLTKGTFDAIMHKAKTGKFLFPDKQYDADFGGYYSGDKAGIYKSNGKTRTRTLNARNALDLKYQLINRGLGLGIQPEQAKEEVRKRKSKFKKKAS